MRKPAFLLALGVAASLLGASRPALAIDDSWTLTGEKNGVKMYKKTVPGSKFMGFAGDGIIDADFARVMRNALDLKRYTEYVDMLTEIETIEEHERDFTVWQHYDLAWPVQDRDYALKGIVEPDPDKKSVTLVWKSVTDPRIPGKDCCVRAEITRTYFRFTSLPGGKTRIECEIMTDPKGSIPAWMANLVQKNWPYNTIKGHEKQAKKPDVKPHPDYLGYR